VCPEVPSDLPGSAQSSRNVGNSGLESTLRSLRSLRTARGHRADRPAGFRAAPPHTAKVCNLQLPIVSSFRLPLTQRATRARAVNRTVLRCAPASLARGDRPARACPPFRHRRTPRRNPETENTMDLENPHRPVEANVRMASSHRHHEPGSTSVRATRCRKPASFKANGEYAKSCDSCRIRRAKSCKRRGRLPQVRVPQAARRRLPVPAVPRRARRRARAEAPGRHGRCRHRRVRGQARRRRTARAISTWAFRSGAPAGRGNLPQLTGRRYQTLCPSRSANGSSRSVTMAAGSIATDPASSPGRAISRSRVPVPSCARERGPPGRFTHHNRSLQCGFCPARVPMTALGSWGEITVVRETGAASDHIDLAVPHAARGPAPCWTCSASVFIPRRMYVTPVASQTRAPLGTGIIAAPEFRAPATAPLHPDPGRPSHASRPPAQSRSARRLTVRYPSAPAAASSAPPFRRRDNHRDEATHRTRQLPIPAPPAEDLVRVHVVPARPTDTETPGC